jgi:RNA polymerase sigma-70 factor (ECF subfamily)
MSCDSDVRFTASSRRGARLCDDGHTVTSGPDPAVQKVVSSLTDAALIADVLEGDLDAFAVLSRRYRDRYARFAVRMLGSAEDADDVLQLAFIRAFRSLAQCEDPSRFGAWLHRIVINECRTNLARRARRERRMVTDQAALDRAWTSHPSDATAMLDEIQHALGQLPCEHREAFVLKHVEDLSYEEISDLTGVGVSALKMRVKRACARLRDLLEGAHHV